METTYPKCETVFTQGECEGHIGKYDTCVAEALDLAGLDWSEDDTGSCEFDGHFMRFSFVTSEGYDISQGNQGPQLVIIPAGEYVIYTASSGAVRLWTYESKDEAIAEMDHQNERYSDWLDD